MKTNTTLGIALAVALTTTIFFNACSSGGGSSSGGGGGSGSSISGKAVAGAPIIGTVTIKDSSSPPETKFATIEADGDYTIDVSDMTAPFMLRADGTVGGRSYSIYSGATTADVNGNVNVTPFTDLIVANIAGQVASAYFNSGNFSTLTTAELNSEADALKTRLLPVLTAIGVSSSIDLLRASFNADHTGIDAALDILRVETDPNTGISTITNLINNQTITNDAANPAATTIDATGVSTGLTDLQAIVANFDTFTSLFASSIPSPSNSTLLGLFDSGFLLDGENLSQFLTEITSDSGMIGIQFTNVALESITSATSTVKFTPIQSGITQDPMTFNLIKSSGIWKITGNGRQVKAELSSFARLQNVYISSVYYPDHIDTGLKFNIEDSANVGIDFAIVSGPGLPAHTAASATGGVLYYKDLSGGQFTAAAYGQTYNGSTPTPITTYGHEQIPMVDGDINNISDGDTYSVELWQWNGGSPTLYDTYTVTLAKKPYLNTALTTSSFGSITAPSASGLMSVASSGGTLNVTWSIPSGLHSEEVSFYRYGNGSGTNSENIEDNNILPTATSNSISVTAPDSGFGTTQGANINLFMRDAFNRDLITIMTAP